MAEATTGAREIVDIAADGTTAGADGHAELPSLRSEGERLKLERDNAQLRAELAQLDNPWWRKGSIVTTLTALIAAVVPVTTAVQAHYQKERELALQESKQAHEIRTSYLDRLDKPGAKLRTLRFVLATTNDPTLKAWAEEEKKEVKAELDEIDRKIAAIDADAEVARSSEKVLDEKIRTADEAVKAGQTGADRKAAQANLDLLRRQKYEIEQRLQAARNAAAKAERDRGVHLSKECLENPLAKGCS
jgi:hypothetical protein